MRWLPSARIWAASLPGTRQRSPGTARVTARDSISTAPLSRHPRRRTSSAKAPALAPRTLREDIDQHRALLARDDVDGALEHSADLRRVVDRTEGLDVEAFGNAGEVWRRVLNVDPDALVLHRAVALAGHKLLVPFVVAVAAVVVDDGQQGDALLRRRV